MHEPGYPKDCRDQLHACDEHENLDFAKGLRGVMNMLTVSFTIIECEPMPPDTECRNVHRI